MREGVESTSLCPRATMLSVAVLAPAAAENLSSTCRGLGPFLVLAARR